jgi:hypothetical protein
VKQRSSRTIIVTGVAIVLGLSLAACSSPAPKGSGGASPLHKHHTSSPSTTTTSTAPTTTTTLPVPTTTTTTIPLVAVPDVIGLKIAPALAAIKAAGLKRVPFNAVCGGPSVRKQSVVIALFLPGSTHDVTLGAKPLTPGDRIPVGTTVATEWSGCFGGGTNVPNVLGLEFNPAKNAITAAGLTWICQSEGTTTIPHRKTVVSESPPHGTRVAAGTTVIFVMENCPASSP